MNTSKCFILLLLPSPVSCVWIDHSYQSVTRPFIFLVVIRCRDLAIMMIMMKIGVRMVRNNDPVSHIIRAQNQCLRHQGLVVSRAPVLPRLAAQHTQRNSSITHVTLSRCHHVTTTFPYNLLFILPPHIVPVLIVVNGIRLKESLCGFK